MAAGDLYTRLRGYRRGLVLAAEKAIREAKESGMALPAKTQFSHLLSLCASASCGEEIENFLRYQAGREGEDRKREKWDRPFVQKLITALKSETKTLQEDDAAMVEAWRLYALYLKRAFTYEKSDSGPNPGAESAGRRGGRDDR